MTGTGIAGAADNGPAPDEPRGYRCGGQFKRQRGEWICHSARIVPGKGLKEFCSEECAKMQGKTGEPATDEEIVVRYTNWRGETADRRIRPCGLTFGTTKWHPEPQWLLEAWDQGKGGATRQFALKDMAGPTMAARLDKERERAEKAEAEARVERVINDQRRDFTEAMISDRNAALAEAAALRERAEKAEAASGLPTFERRAFKELVAEITARATAAESEAAALHQEVAVAREITKSSLCVLCSLEKQFGEQLHPNARKDLARAIEANRAALTKEPTP